MKHIRHTLKFRKGSDVATVIATACWHVGNQQCREKHILELMQRCADERIPWLHLGDTIEAIEPLDVRYCVESHRETIMGQIEAAAGLAGIAKKQLVAITIGNHEDKLSRRIGDIVHDMLLRMYGHDKAEADARWGGGSVLVEFVCPDGTCTAFFAHQRLSANYNNRSPARNETNKREKLRMRLRRFPGDLKVVAHGHTGIVAPPTYEDRLTWKGGKLQMTPVPVDGEWCAMCPSFFGNYDHGDYPSYAELAGYPPTDIGWIEADIRRDGTVADVRCEIVR